MRFLFLSNFFPPAGRGGYEQWCNEVALRMRQHGHDVSVLTSRHNREQCVETDSDWIHRDLFLEMELVSLRNGIAFFTERKAAERASLERLRTIIESEKPDAILIWGMWNLHRSLAALAEELFPNRVAYYMGDYWPSLPTQYRQYWEAKPKNWITALPKLALSVVARWQLKREAKPHLELSNVMFPTQFMHDEFCRLGIQFQNSRVVHGAIDTSQYQNIKPFSPKDDNSSLSLLVAGRLMPEKGIQTAIKALKILREMHPTMRIHLTIVGEGETEHEAKFHTLTKKLGLLEHVIFLGRLHESAMAAIYEKSKVFIFPSIWQEPFGRVLVEAMTAGRIVVGTTVGGAAEILKHEENGLVFQPGDANDLAKQITRLIDNPELGIALAKTARQFVLQRFDIRQMTDSIEETLLRLGAKHKVAKYKDVVT